ncbi:membrane-associated protein, putative, partial [Bodo saltans]
MSSRFLLALQEISGVVTIVIALLSSIPPPLACDIGPISKEKSCAATRQNVALSSCTARNLCCCCCYYCHRTVVVNTSSPCVCVGNASNTSSSFSLTHTLPNATSTPTMSDTTAEAHCTMPSMTSSSPVFLESPPTTTSAVVVQSFRFNHVDSPAHTSVPPTPPPLSLLFSPLLLLSDVCEVVSLPSLPPSHAVDDDHLLIRPQLRSRRQHSERAQHSIFLVCLLWLCTLLVLITSQRRGDSDDGSASFAHAQTWTPVSCAASLNSPSVYYKLTGCSFMGSPLTVTNAAGLWLSGGSYVSVSFTPASMSGFVLTTSDAIVFSANPATSLFTLPAMSNWVISFASTTLTNTAVGSHPLLEFTGVVSSTSIAIVSSSSFTASGTSYVAHFTGAVNSVSLTISGAATVNSATHSFFAASTVSGFYLVVGDGAQWLSTAQSLIHVEGDVSDFHGTFTATATPVDMKVYEKHFEFCSSGDGIIISSTGVNLESTIMGGASDITGEDEKLGLVYFSNAGPGIVVKNINICHANNDLFNLQIVVRIESNTAAVDGLVVRLENFTATGSAVFSVMIYAQSNNVRNVEFYTNNVSYYCFWGCLSFGTVTNIVVRMLAGSGNIYYGILLGNNILNASITYTSNPNSYTKEDDDLGLPLGYIATVIDSFVTAYITLIDVRIFGSGTGIQFSGYYPYIGMICVDSGVTVSNVHLTFSNAQIFDVKAEDQGGSFLKMIDTAAISDVTIVIQDTFYRTVDTGPNPLDGC